MEILNKKIFIVEDDKFFAQLLQNFLNTKGFKKCPIFYSFEDLKMNLYFNPDLIILDYSFINSEQNGLDILKSIKKNKVNTKVIILSGQKDAKIAVKLIRFGASEYIEKTENFLIEVENSINKLFLNELKTNLNF